MAELDDFVNEYTSYDIVCSECGASTGSFLCEYDVIQAAEEYGYIVSGDDILCGECAENV